MVSEDLICQKYTTIPLQFLHRNGIIHCRLWMSLMIPFMPKLLFSPTGDSVRLNCSVFCGKKPVECKANWKINGLPLSPGQGYRQTHQEWAYSILNLSSKISKSGVYSPQYVPHAHQMECVMQRIIRIWERPEKANVLPDLPNLRTSAPNCVSSFTTTVPGPLYSPYASSGQRHICCIFLSAYDQPSRRQRFYPANHDRHSVSLCQLHRWLGEQHRHGRALHRQGVCRRLTVWVHLLRKGSLPRQK